MPMDEVILEWCAFWPQWNQRRAEGSPAIAENVGAITQRADRTEKLRTCDGCRKFAASVIDAFGYTVTEISISSQMLVGDEHGRANSLFLFLMPTQKIDR